VSFNGYFFVARSERPLYELASIRAALDTTSAGEPRLELILGIRRDGLWQQVQCDATEYVEPRAIVAETGAPALVILTVESSVADVGAASPDGEDWFAILSPDGGQGYHVSDPGPAPEVAARAALWAMEAGLTPDHVRILAAIGMRPGISSEGIGEFLAGLGFRFGADSLVADRG
jgi:hypothetical protein